jgi:hypothetical protein
LFGELATRVQIRAQSNQVKAFMADGEKEVAPRRLHPFGRSIGAAPLCSGSFQLRKDFAKSPALKMDFQDTPGIFWQIKILIKNSFRRL